MTLSACFAQEENVEVVLYNASVYTVNQNQPWAEAIYFRDGVIEYIGSSEETLELASKDAELIDLKGKMVMPGIHDVHMHPLEAMSPFSGTCLLDSRVENAEEYIPELENCAPEQIATEWVLGFGHSVFTLLETSRPPKDILDEAIPDKPVAIMEETSHSFWVNSKALELAGITKDTANPPGGVIVKDPQTGQPTGILFDSAGDLIMDLAWAPTDEILELNYEGLLEALGLLNENGITSVCEARTYWKRNFQDAWLRAEREGALSVRAILNLWAYPNMNDDEQIRELASLYQNDPEFFVAHVSDKSL